jgi:Ca2+-binding EF-hand superfamily protein
MGNKICYHPRMLLTQDIALHFKSSHLIRDVIPIIDKWRREGAELVFGLQEFADTFDIIGETERQFNVFDTDRNGRIDAHEVLMVYIILSCGDVGKKIDTALSIFDLNLQGARTGHMNFDEAVILVNAAAMGVQKVCEMTFTISEDELIFACKSLFDMYRINHDKTITTKQFKDWVFKDPSPKHFVDLFHSAQGLNDIDTSVQRINLEQGMVYSMLAHGQMHIMPEALRGSQEFRKTLNDANSEEVEALIKMMMEDSRMPGMITTDRYHAVLRPWNIFNECDSDGSHTLDDKEVEILLWFQMRQRPSQDFVYSFTKFLDGDGNGEISRTEWTAAILNCQKRTQDCDRHSESLDEFGDETEVLQHIGEDPALGTDASKHKHEFHKRASETYARHARSHDEDHPSLQKAASGHFSRSMSAEAVGVY